MQEQIVHLTPDPKYDYLFDMPTGKTNPFVKLTEEDRKAGVKILCKEPYAQELYNKYVGENSRFMPATKDLNAGQIYNVRLINYRKSERIVECEEVNSCASIFIPQSEFDFSLNMESDEEFPVLTTKMRNGAMYGSLKKCKGILCERKLAENMENNIPFKVKVVRLIKGGFIATYEDCVECFLPGAHAAANIIYDFESYVGKTIDVMVDNYDKTSQYYIVSHKKYIQYILPKEIHKLEFGKKYTGKLTSNPTKFGMFVEFCGIFTGLIHVAEFDNYEEACKKYKSGSEIEFYITKISTNDGTNYKINLTTSADKIDETTKIWMDYKAKLEGHRFKYSYDVADSKINILDNNGDIIIKITVNREAVVPFLDKTSQVLVTDINIIDKDISIDLVE